MPFSPNGQDIVNAIQTAQTMIYSGDLDPSVTPVEAIAGTLYLGNSGAVAGKTWQKQDNGETANWILVGTEGGGGGTVPQYTQARYIDSVIGNNATGDGSFGKPWKTLQFAVNQITDNAINAYVFYAQGNFSSEGVIAWKKNISLIGVGNESSSLVPVASIAISSSGSSNSKQTFQNLSGTIDVAMGSDTGQNRFNINNCFLTGFFGLRFGGNSAISTTIVELNNCRSTTGLGLTHAGDVLAIGCNFTFGAFQSVTLIGRTNFFAYGCKFAQSVNSTAAAGFTPVVSVDPGVLGRAGIPQDSVMNVHFEKHYIASGLLQNFQKGNLVVFGSTVGGNISTQLPLASSYTGLPITFKRNDLGVSAGTFQIVPDVADTIGGQPTFTLLNDGDYVTLVSTAGDWAIVAQGSSKQDVLLTSDPSVGGGISETLNVTGILLSDTIISATQSVAGGNNTALTAYNILGDGIMNAQWSGDPGAGAIVNILVKRNVSS
jgi:hypothetical protein